eukprot:583744-Prorocentrum_minimum.AAC.3
MIKITRGRWPRGVSAGWGDAALHFATPNHAAPRRKRARASLAVGSLPSPSPRRTVHSAALSDLD